MRRESKIRWWPAAVILVAAAAVVLWSELLSGRSGQDRFVLGMSVAAAALVLLVAWLLLLSRLRWRVRLLAFGGLVVALAAASWSLEIRGVTGDLVPVLAWRWSAGEAPAELAVAATPGGVALAAPTDYPRFLGPGGDATLPEIRLDSDWRARPPREIWRRQVGEGWSAFAIAGDLAVTQEQRGDQELVTAYLVASGEPVWSHADPGRYDETIAGPGPRATPTVDGGRVYTMGSLGRLNALDLATGRRLWSHQVVEEHGTTHPEWGKASSPLVVDGLVVASVGVAGGPSLVAYDAATGEPVWSAGVDRASYSSPLVATLAGRRQIVIFNRESVSGHDPASGGVLWRFPWPSGQPNVAQPLPIGDDRLLVSSGYGLGAKLLRIRPETGGAQQVELVWESPRLKAKFASMVLRDGYVYGLDDGVLACLDPATGERCWKAGRYGHGQLILAGELLLVLTEGGEVVLVEAAPEAHRELARLRVLDTKSWNPPALAGSRLLVRNDREAAAYELPLAGR